MTEAYFRAMLDIGTVAAAVSAGLEGRGGYMAREGLYLKIDMKKTGMRLELLMQERGYTVKDIQSLLHLSCPQPVYRWLRGQILPSVDHLFVLARVLQVHMEELLAVAYAPEGIGREACSRRRRMIEYGRRYLRWEAA